MGFLAAKVKTPISTTSPELGYGLPPCAAGLKRRGFTLLELLVVLAIGSLLVALVPPAFDRLREVSQYRDTVRAIMLDLRRARQQAQNSGQVVNFRIDLTGRQFGIEGNPWKALPAALEIRATVGTRGAPDHLAQANIAFLPDGGSSGGTIELVRPSGGGSRLRVDWLFGQITQQARTP